MLAQEMAGVYKPTSDTKQKPSSGVESGGDGIPTSLGNKWGYNPMYLQQQQKQQHATTESQSRHAHLQPQTEFTYEQSYDRVPQQDISQKPTAPPPATVPKN